MAVTSISIYLFFQNIRNIRLKSNLQHSIFLVNILYIAHSWSVILYAYNKNALFEDMKEEKKDEHEIKTHSVSDPELEFLKDKIEKDNNIKLIAMAKNPDEARNMTRLYDPDIIIMDILDPQSGGIGFLKRINQFYLRPVLLISSVTKMPFHFALSAFKLGATDIVDKDALFLFSSIPHEFLISKIKIITS